jgi:hypothetical protein
MMVAVDVINGRSSGGSLVVEEVLLQEEKETAPRREGSGGGFDLTEALKEKAVWRKSSTPREGGFGGRSSPRGVKEVLKSTKTFRKLR